MRTAVVLLLAAAAGCQPEPEVVADPAPADSPFPIAYAGWPALTDVPVQLPGPMVLFCRAPEEMERRGPHFAPVVRYYANPDAEAVRSGAAPVPAGTTVVKEKYSEDGGPVTAVAAMVKREAGYDPGNGDWEYVYTYRTEDGSWDTQRGKLASCIDCHRGAKDKDFLFRTYLAK